MGLNSEEIKDIPALFVTFTLGRTLLSQNADLRLITDGIEIGLSDFSVNGAGDLQIDYYMQQVEGQRRGDVHQSVLDLGYEQSFILNNTWFHQPPLEVQPDAEQSFGKDTRKEPQARRRALPADKVMDDTDLNILRMLTFNISNQALELMSNHWSSVNPARKPKGFSVGQIVFNLHERDRLNAAWQVRTLGLTKAQDVEMVHLRTGGVEPCFSGDYGTEQEWLKQQGDRSNRTSRAEPLTLNDDERDFFAIVTGYVEGKHRKKG
jgi:hypothetical protein